MVVALLLLPLLCSSPLVPRCCSCPPDAPPLCSALSYESYLLDYERATRQAGAPTAAASSSASFSSVPRKVSPKARRCLAPASSPQSEVEVTASTVDDAASSSNNSSSSSSEADSEVEEGKLFQVCSHAAPPLRELPCL